MTSVNTNAAALTALRNLQSTVSQLDTTQNRISTGLKIGEAKDNAAYWAISTTLKSDNKSLSTVKDALGLGAATVDVAYQGLTKSKDVLDEIKSKLTAATQDGVDRDVIQGEITELQNQLKSIATSSIFSGENWLSVNSDAADFSSTKQVVSSFARAADNSVSIGTVNVDISNVSLFDASTAKGKNGILDGAVNLTDSATGRAINIGGVANTDGNGSVSGLTATATGGVSGLAEVTGTAVAATSLGATANAGAASTATYTGSGITLTTAMASGDTFAVTFSDGNIRTYTATGAKSSLTWAEIAGAASSGTTATATLSSGGVITTNTNTATPVTISSFAQSTASAVLPTVPTATTVAGSATVTAAKATVSSGTLTLGDFAVGDKLTIRLNVNGTATEVTTAALTKAGATLAFSDIASALDTALNGIADVANSSGAMAITAAADGAKTTFSLEKLTAVDSTGAAKTLTNGIGTLPTAAKFETGSFSAVTLDADDKLYFKLQVDTDTGAKNLTIDQALVEKTLGTTAGHVKGQIKTAAEFKSVIDAAMTAANITSVTTAVTNTDKITFTSKTFGATSKIILSDVSASQGGSTISVDTIDISKAGLTKAGATSNDQIKQVLQAYISVVNQAINKVTTAASNLGSVASRIDLQKTFVNTLMDTIDKGVGNLVDADMSEESTKLQALQVKQQLGVQALSIANQSAQNIISLFRS